MSTSRPWFRRRASTARYDHLLGDTVTLNVHYAHTGGTLTIRLDTSVGPDSAPIILIDTAGQFPDFRVWVNGTLAAGADQSDDDCDGGWRWVDDIDGWIPR